MESVLLSGFNVLVGRIYDATGSRGAWTIVMGAAALSLLIGMVALIFAPTYMNRVEEGLMSVSGSGLFDSIRRFWYSLDGSEIAYNLLPSFHCINSTICWLGVRGRPELPRWFRIYTFITMILIFFSTVFVKQHYVLDIVSGIAVALIAYGTAKKYHLGRIVDRLCGEKGSAPQTGS